MTQQHHTHKPSVLNPNLVAIIIIINFFVIGVLLLSSITVNTSAADDANKGEVAVLDSTATPQPPTLMPTAVIPTATVTSMPTSSPVPSPMPTSTPQVVADAGGVAGTGSEVSANYDAALVEQGRNLFITCSACHGPEGRGLPNLGKDLVASEFVAAQTDDELVQFIITGRPIWDPLNTTGIDMPGKGGNPAMTTEDIQAIVAYIRTLAAQQAGTMEMAPANNTTTAAYDPALIAEGQQLFALCAACHGADARGLPNLGKDLVASEFVAGLTDEALLEFIKIGRPIWDPLNTTGIDMPGKGGNPAMTDEQIVAVIAYVRSLALVGG